jgi:hypothetical protein
MKSSPAAFDRLYEKRPPATRLAQTKTSVAKNSDYVLGVMRARVVRRPNERTNAASS